MADHYSNPASTIDLIVPYQEGIVYVLRKHEPFKGYWALPGGFLEMGKETLEEGGVRELYEETNLVAKTRDLKLYGVYSDPKRDPRGHVIAHAYEVGKYKGTLKAKDDAADVRVFKEIPEKLAFDHIKILEDYFKKKRLRVLI
ncbi:MAG TPA: NUDIX hydrolase [Candidatus Nanoarchaeia archaeon]|nr:NUDIX hydrolase [Candidatus Nanoarchaeia archaeon]